MQNFMFSLRVLVLPITRKNDLKFDFHMRFWLSPHNHTIPVKLARAANRTADTLFPS